MKNKMKIYAVLLAATLMVTNSSIAVAQNPVSALAQPNTAALPKGVERITSVEGITEYRLANGLRVLLFPDATNQTTTVNITYLVGSVMENYGETGMAHLLEHLMFKGTPRHPNIPAELTEHGTIPNGTTTTDRTNYFESFAATDENLNWALDLEADRMVNSFIAKKDLESEMTVVRNEFEAGENSPSNVLYKTMLSTAYVWHNYGKPAIGARSDIENVPIERLQTFYRTYYQPDNAVLTIAGRFDEQRTLALVDKYFSRIPRSLRELPKLYTVEPTQEGERTVTLRRAGDTQIVEALYHVPATSHPDNAALTILAQVLASTPSGRLYKELVETGKASAVVMGSPGGGRDSSLAGFGVEVRQGNSLDTARDALLQVTEGLGSNPVTKEEVERARAKLLKILELSFHDPERIGRAISEYIAAGDWRLLFLYRDRIRRITVEEVQAVATRYFKPSNRTLGIFIPTPKPDRVEIPSNPDVAALLKDYKGGAPLAAGEVFDPSPANIEARTRRIEAGGLKMALLPKKTRGGHVVAHMVLRYGDEQSLMNRAAVARLAGVMLMRGTANKTRQQIQDELDRLKAGIGIFGSPTAAGISIETVRESLPAVMRLVAELLREPSFPEKEFDVLKGEVISGFERRRSDPGQIANTALMRHINPYPKGDVRYENTPEEQIAELNAATLEQTKQFYRDFYGASNAQLTVIGDFDAQEIGKLATELFGDWKSAKPFKRVPDLYKEVAPVNETFQTPEKANANLLAGCLLSIRDDDPDYPAFSLAAYILGGGSFPSSRLAVRIRQKEGLSYSVGSSIFVSSVDRYGWLVNAASFAPQNAAKVEAALKEEIARMLKDGVTAEEVEAAKSGYLQSYQVFRADDAALLGRFNAYLFIGRTWQWDADFEAKIKALTPERVNAALRRYIDPSKLTIIKAGDFSKPALK